MKQQLFTAAARDDTGGCEVVERGGGLYIGEHTNIILRYYRYKSAFAPTRAPGSGLTR